MRRNVTGEKQEAQAASSLSEQATANHKTEVTTDTTFDMASLKKHLPLPGVTREYHLAHRICVETSNAERCYLRWHKEPIAVSICHMLARALLSFLYPTTPNSRQVAVLSRLVDDALRGKGADDGKTVQLWN